MSLAVEADSTVMDVLYHCSDSMPHPINTACSVVLEKYTPLGLERRLRRYERLRDVMNSWDRDTQNSLLVVPSDAFESDRDLDAAAVPDTDAPPQGFLLQLHHSQRPGKWQKRFVTLLEGGQMYAAKKADAVPGPADKDAQPLCHLSDFDIYTPTEAQMRKHLKPPKKYCYAVKSQQKTTVFQNTENFVHFFSTEDPAVAQQFHSLVHGWRSWYLVHRRAAVARQTREKIERTPPPQITAVRHKPKKSISHVKVQGHRLKVSVDESPYAIGAFQPLLDLTRFDKPMDDFGKDWIPDNGRFSVRPPLPKAPSSRSAARSVAGKEPAPPSPGTAHKAAPPVALAPTAAVLDGPISATLDSPFTDAPAAVTSKPAPPEPENSQTSPWFPSAADHSAKQRARAQSLRDAARPSTSSGVPHHHHHHQHHHAPPHRQPDKPSRRGGGGGGGRRHPPAPLVNLAPQFKEAPQWSTEGRGHGVRAPPGTHLVDLATGPAAAATTAAAARLLEVPPRNLMRRDGGGSPRGAPPSVLPPPPPPSSSGRQRSKSTSSGAGPARSRGTEARAAPPPLPRPATRDGERGRDPWPREFAARGRSGTLKY